MHLHVLIIGLFEPYEHVTKAFLPDEPATPAMILSQSKASLETLIRLYYLRHGFESYDPTMILFISLLAWTSLREYRKMSEISSSHLDAVRSTLVLCAKFMWDQSGNYFLAELVFRFFKSTLPGKEEVRLLREVAEADEDASRLSVMVQEARSGWPVGIFSTAKADVEESRLDHFIAWCEKALEDPSQRASTQVSEQPESPEANWARYSY